MEIFTMLFDVIFLLIDVVLNGIVVAGVSFTSIIISFFLISALISLIRG